MPGLLRWCDQWLTNHRGLQPDGFNLPGAEHEMGGIIREDGGCRLSTCRGQVVHYCLLDNSYSMDDRDYRPSRLEGCKQCTGSFLETLAWSHPDDKVVLLAFCGTVSLIGKSKRIGVPGAVGLLQQRLSDMHTGNATRLDRGFRRVVRMVLAQRARSAVGCDPFGVRVLVLTDGGSQGFPLPVALLLKSMGAVIEIVGIGGSHWAVNERLLKRCASWENGRLLYRFIGDKDGGTEALVEHFTGIALR